MIGTRLSDRYQIVSELGQGDGGYLARDPLVERNVAVGIIGIYDFGAHGSSLFYVMPLVRGHNLRDAMNEQKLTLGEIISIGQQVAEALDYSHGASIVHRDVKPENIMISRDGDGSLRARITDFGLAIADRDHRLTGSGVLVGCSVPTCRVSRGADVRQALHRAGRKGRHARDWQHGTVGTGPFRVVRFEPERRLALERTRTIGAPGFRASSG